MDIRRLQAFSKVFETRSFSKAGKELFLSQPTISSHVALLEEELGVPLFDRVGRTVLSTQAGEILYSRAQKIFDLLVMAKAEIDLLRHAVSGPIILGGSTIPADYLLPPLLAAFVAKYPEVRIDLRVGDSASVIDLVNKGDVMLGMVGSATEHPDLHFEPVLVDELILVGAPGVFRGMSSCSMDKLLAFPWIMREAGSGTRNALERSLRRFSIDISGLRTAIQVQNTQAMLGCILAGVGVCVTSRMVVAPYLHRGELETIPIEGLQMSRDFYIVFHKKRELFPATQKLIAFLTSALRNEPLKA
ncbi:MAG: selenium metabolism-associated LysR family transcriptional regulator [Desulfoplanes sp.]|jgi:DNA-binding transcriptional LysR family regulator|nr:selenium metabolism-associated LysR family transcriptional regulator [Desulfoplanes sp.]MDD4648637.1 selenium metabolism-associated LysR family transcriptional regulator [Desulfoplanes sp.]